jgi:hypothetical protein
MRVTSVLITFLGLASLVLSKGLYDPVKSYVTILNHKNFDAQVTKNRQKGISIVHFYKESGKNAKQ